MLDDTQRHDDPNYLNTLGYGSLDKERYEWLVRELEKGQREGKLMIIAAQQIFNNAVPFLPTGSYNVELILKLSPDMQIKIGKYGTEISK